MNFKSGAFLLFVSIATILHAQREETVIARYTYRAPLSETRVESQFNCLEHAQIEIIGKTFGTVVSENNMSYFSEDSNGSDTNFFNLGESDVRGIWLESLGDTIWTIKNEPDFTIYTVELKGKIKEMVKSPIQIDCRLLCNGTNPQRDEVREYTFYSGDAMYPYFKSPVKGHLAIYNVENSTGMVTQRLLPYSRQSCAVYDIEPDSAYIFYSPEHYNESYDGRVGHCWMKTNMSKEHNQIYFIFSPNNFSRPSDKTVSKTLPHQLDFRSFQKWLAGVRKHDSDLCVEKIFVDIKKK